jgi:hypothetical protein
VFTRVYGVLLSVSYRTATGIPVVVFGPAASTGSTASTAATASAVAASTSTGSTVALVPIGSLITAASSTAASCSPGASAGRQCRTTAAAAAAGTVARDAERRVRRSPHVRNLESKLRQGEHQKRGDQTRQNAILDQILAFCGVPEQSQKGSQSITHPRSLLHVWRLSKAGASDEV